MGLFLHRIVELSSFFHDFLHGHLAQYIFLFSYINILLFTKEGLIL